MGKLWAVGLALMLAAGAAFGQPAQHVATFISMAPPSSADAWVASIAGSAGDWTDKHGAEACGVIAESPDGRFGIVLATTGSPLDCGLSHSNVPPGFTSTGETFHTHPDRAGGRARMSLRDQRRLGNVRTAAKDFSPQDYADGPGYVVTGGFILHQRGAGTRRVVRGLP